MTVHLASLVKVTTGAYRPSPYAACGRYLAPTITTKAAEVDCAKCAKSRALTAIIANNAQAPAEDNFGPMDARKLAYADVDA